MKRLLLAASILAGSLALVSGPAEAQPVTGLYVGAGAGPNFMNNEFNKNHYLRPTVANTRDRTRFDTGVTGLGSIGWGFGNGLRLEIEGDYRYNEFDRSNQTAPYKGIERKYGGMGNVLFDFDIGSPYIFPYVGVGGGYMETNRRSQSVTPFGIANYNYSTGGAAYQGIAGVSLPIPFVVGLSATVEYRFLGVADSAKNLTLGAPLGGTTLQRKTTNDLNHSAMIGLRYAFNVAPPAPPPASVPVAAAPSALSRSYLVFFDWDRADLTTRARQIIAEAAQNIARVEHTRIEVDGHADKSGSPQYNQRLSLRRAQNVAAELVRDGVAQSAIDIQAFGDTKPLVPTAAGVREPQNRRVEIIIK